MAKEVKQWITMNGQHIPIYDGESKEDAVNRAIANKNEDTRQKQIANNKKEADRLNGKKVSVYDREFGINPKNGLKVNDGTPYKTWGDAINESIDQVCKTDLLSPHKNEIKAYVESKIDSLVAQDDKKAVSPENIVAFVNNASDEWMNDNFDRLLAEKNKKR